MNTDRVVIDLKDYHNKQDQAPATRSRPLTREEMREAAIEAMADSTVMWENLGPDAIPQPYSTPGDFAQLQNIEAEQQFSEQIHRYLMEKDFTALGKALHDMAVDRQISVLGLDEVRVNV